MTSSAGGEPIPGRHPLALAARLGSEGQASHRPSRLRRRTLLPRSRPQRDTHTDRGHRRNRQGLGSGVLPEIHFSDLFVRINFLILAAQRTYRC